MPEGGSTTVQDLLAEVIQLEDSGDRAAVEELLARNPEHAPTLVRLVDSLRDAGLVGPLEQEPDWPARLGGYELMRPIGEGGMGRVFLARQTTVHRLVALKLIHRALVPDGRLVERFRKEATAAARLSHPNIVTVYEAGEADGQCYLAMELVPGRSLEEVMRSQPPATADLVRWCRDIAGALHAAHSEGIVHRDVKPDNIRITDDGRAVLVDFGLAKDLVAASMTQTTGFQGSPHFASPEQVAAGREEVGFATDIYSLGATLYRCLTRRLPFDAETTEQLFHQILSREPPLPRHIDATLSRDLDAVVAKAMEKEPVRRYAGADELAADLDAVLTFRPVRAKPAGVVTQAVKWARRNRTLAGLATALVLALLALPVVLIVQDLSAERARRARARSLVAQAQGLLATYRATKAASADLEQRLPGLQRAREVRFLTEREDALIDDEEDELEVLRQKRSLAVSEVLAKLDRAGQLDAELASVNAVRTELFLEKLREAEAAGDTASVSFFRRLVESSDPEGRAQAEITGSGTVTLTVQPAGATVYLFRYSEHATVVAGGERRLVPVPFAGSGPIAPGTPCLLVVRGAGDLRPGDLITELAGEQIASGAKDALRRAVAGGVPAVVLASGATRSLVLPQGLDVVATAAPFCICDEARLGNAPVTERLPRGSYMAFVRHPGFEDQRCPIAVGRDSEQSLEIELLPEGTSPEGFVYIAAAGSCERGPDAPAAPERTHGLWLQRREVTSREYLDFLNDDATRARIDASERQVLVPRAEMHRTASGRWRRDAAGRFSLPPSLDPDTPVLGVSCADALAYASWRTRRAERNGEPFLYELPTIWDWQWAALGPGGRRYVFGNRFRPKWFNSTYSREEPAPEPVLSYPVDESPFGVFDMTGSAAEYCGNWYWEEKRWRTRVGSSWGHSREKVARILFQEGRHEDSVASGLGFRLVAVRRD